MHLMALIIGEQRDSIFRKRNAQIISRYFGVSNIKKEMNIG